MQFFKHGLAMKDSEPSAKDEAAIHGIASQTGAFSFPVLMFAEALQPMAGILQNVFVGLEPVGELLIGAMNYRKLSRLLSQPKYLEVLIKALKEKGF